LQFTEKDVVLWRDRKNPMHRARTSKFMKNSFGPKWGKILSHFSGFLPDGVFNRIRAILLRFTACCETCWIKNLKALSARAIKLNILQGHGVWSYMADLKVLGGYDCAPNRVDVFEEMKDKILDQDGRTLLWTRRMEKKLDAAVADINFRAHSDQISFGQFMEFRDAWGLSGASTEGTPIKIAMCKTDVNMKKAGPVDGKDWKRTSLRGKFANSLGSSEEELVLSALTEHPMLLYPFRKEDEPARTRGVISADSRSYRRCAYVDKILVADYNGKKLWTTLGLSPLRKAESRSALYALNARKEVYAVSLDQSEFDMSQTKSAVRYAIGAVFDAAIAASRPDLRPELDKLKNVELTAFDTAIVIFRTPAGELRIQWKRGVPSGHAWTALIDTLINRAEAETVAEDLGVEILDARYQGDDAVLFTRTPTTGEDWAEGYARYGLLVNGEKTWVSNLRYDYLHEINGPEGAWGFPSRMCKTLLWKKPNLGGTGFKPAHTRDSEYFTALLKAHRRGMANCREVAEHLLYRRLLPWTEGQSKGARDGKARRRAAEITNTPLALGGLGFSDFGRMAMTIVVSGVKEAASRIRILGKLHNDTPQWRACLKQRFSNSFPMPGIETAYYHTRISSLDRRSVLTRPPMKGFGLRAFLQWTPQDYSRVDDAWTRKVRLEAALYDQKITITKDMLPDRRVAQSILGADRAARMLHKEQSLQLDLSTETSSSEPYAAISNDAKSMWDMALIIKLRSKLFHLGTAARKIAQWALFTSSRFTRTIRVAV